MTSIPMTEEVLDGVLDDGYEEVVEFECPVCNTHVAQESKTCPGCGAVFISPEQMEQEVLQSAAAALEGGADVADDDVDLSLEPESEEDYALDETPASVPGVADEDLDDEELDAELAAMEEDLRKEVADAPIEVADAPDPVHLDLGYEEDMAAEEEVEASFGKAVAVSAEDHDALTALAEPTFTERLFARAGIGMFLAGGALSLLVIMWDPLHGQQLALGLMQLQFLVFSLALFIVGFTVEMLQAYSLAKHDDLVVAA